MFVYYLKEDIMSKRKHFLWCLGLSVCLLLTLSVNVTFAADRTLKMRIDQGIEIFDPARFTSHATSPVLRMVYDTLVDYYPGEWPNPRPEVAERYEVSKDGMIHTFYLKKGIKWHKGYGEVSAEDVKFSIDRVRDPKTKSPYRSIMDSVIDRVEVPDNYTVKIFMKKPDPAFIAKLAPWRPGALFSKKAVEKYGDAYGKSAEATVGCGPYELVSWIPNQKAVFKRFEEYHGQKPWFQNVEMLVITDETTAVLALQKGELDHCYLRVAENLPIVEADKNLKVYKGTSGSLICSVAFNMEDKVFKDVRVRRALAYAIDKDLLVENVVGPMGQRACGFLSPGAYFAAMGCDELDAYPYNPQKAKALLAEAGYDKGFKVNYTEINLKPWKDVGPVVQAYWSAVGVDMEINAVPIKEWFAKVYKAEERCLEMGFGTRPPEPSIFLYSVFHSSSARPGLNAMNYKGCDALLEKVQSTVDPEERKKLYQQIQKKLVEDCPIIPLIYETQIVAARKDLDLGRGAEGAKLTCPYWHWYWIEDMKFR
jgi:peptide/nickel transport system substrate-binding protein